MAEFKFVCPCSICTGERAKRAEKKAHDTGYVEGYQAGEERSVQVDADRIREAHSIGYREAMRVDDVKLFNVRREGYIAGRAAVIRIRDNEENAALQQAHKAGYEQGHDDAEDTHYDSGYEDGRDEMLDDVKGKLKGLE